MRRPKRAANPFYALLVVVGILFTITACAYGAMTVKQMRPTLEQTPNRLTVFLDKHGLAVITVELAVLAVATISAIYTDNYWSQKMENTLQKDRTSNES